MQKYTTRPRCLLKCSHASKPPLATNMQQENTKINQVQQHATTTTQKQAAALQLHNSKRGNKLSNHGSRTEQATATYSGTAAKEEINSANTVDAQKQAAASTALQQQKEETNSAKQQSYTKKRK